MKICAFASVASRLIPPWTDHVTIMVISEEEGEVDCEKKDYKLISYLGSGAKMFALQDSETKTERGKSMQLGAKISVLQD